MSYHYCRWYDPYPKLAFALKMLYFAPGSLQIKAMQTIKQLVESNWEAVQLQRHLQTVKPVPRGKRWYDSQENTAKTVDLIKESPDILKEQVADELLFILSAELG